MTDHTTPPHDDKLVWLEEEPACLTAALEYCKLGWSVVPLCPWDHMGILPTGHVYNCKRPGKCPPWKWKHLMKRRLTADELIRFWQKNPGLNVGVILGPISGLVGVDIDGSEGEEALQQISGGDVPPTMEFTTGGGGRRLLYSWPEGITPRSTSVDTGAKPLHLLGEGSLTVMPPSRHRNGNFYRWKE